MQKFITLIVVLLLFAPKNMTAQFESIFGDTNTSWDILTGACDSWCSNRLNEVGDTVINANTYKIVTDSSQFIFLREDTLQGKVWYYEDDQNSEYLLMDLSLVVGDTFEIFNTNNAQIEYYDVDSVYYFNNKKHVRLLNFANLCTLNDFQITFIEGVGTNSGLTYKYESYKSRTILCHKKNVTTNLLYNDYAQNYSIDTCEYCVSSTQEIFAPSEYTIFPNPVIDVINISSNEYPIDFEIYDVAGKLVKSENTREKVYSINIENLQMGVYIIVLKHEDKIVASKKLIKVE